MPCVNFDEISKYIDLPASARQLLEVPEQQIIANLNIRTHTDGVLAAKAYVVYYNTARGPAKGGIRLAEDVTLDETTELSERMTWKTALVRIPFGGGKSGIAIAPKKMSLFERNELVREFVHIMNRELTSSAYIPAPDLGSNAGDMAIIYGQTHQLESVTGKPPRVGGLPGREHATGRGVAYITKRSLQEFLNRDVKNATVAIQGFGNVGGWTANFLHEWGARIVAVSDVSGGIVKKDGLDIPSVQDYCRKNGSLEGYSADRVSNEGLLAAEADVLIPAAVGHVLNDRTAPKVKAKLVIEGANGPTTAEADEIMTSNSTLVMPDILANAGGVVASYIEWRNAKSGSITHKEEVFEAIEHILEDAFQEVVSTAKKHGIQHRLGAEVIAVDEVVRAMNDRGWT